MSKSIKIRSKEPVFGVLIVENCFGCFVDGLSENLSIPIVRVMFLTKLFSLDESKPLISLDLKCKRIVASFHHSHSIQLSTLALKQRLNYLKYSNQIHLSQPRSQQ
jgi:hypothetical protein